MDPTQFQPGYRLDRYELLCPLAYGGMASVWLARFGGRLGFERMVVIKMILPQFSQDPRFQEMFLDEARIASKIEHSNVARILDVGEHQDNYYIVMEWVDGDSLSKVLRAAEQKKEAVPLGVALRICADAAAGLNAAHELKDRDGTPLGVVHRDVSPQNILIANNGATMIIDFGVAKARDRVSADTSAGQLKGKIRYMAPEQALGRSIDHRADVWAIGAMMYELFTGSAPYEGPNEVATLHKLTSGHAPPPLPHALPEVLRVVCERALAYDATQRFSTALELNLAIEGAMVEINEPTTAAIVAHYTGQLLADRKGARKRAVDAALAEARKREHSGAPPPNPSLVPMASPSGSLPGHSMPPRDHTLQLQGLSLSGGPAAELSLNESPSAGTMGAASFEYQSDGALLAGSAAPRKRHAAAAALGVSAAVGVVGAILIISAAFTKDGKAAGRGAAAGGSVVPVAPTTSVTTTAASSVASDSTPVPADTAAPSTTTSTARDAPTSSSRSTSTLTHRTSNPPPPPPPTQRPRTTTPGPTSPALKPDRGF